ncbi:MAG: 2-C-methyl-D-erythritol 4-phosphate cytidylyltransferase [Lachnospiraceae bacterium]|nr:2-C-methyl-D-erythritol 4-phosphate cytidylyltransferase [Lachnospiraceae bacterium]
MNAAVLLAGGTGTRAGSDIPKQYIKLSDHMMLTRSAAVLLESGHTDCMYIVAEDRWRDPIIKDIKEAGLPAEKIRGFADPGKNRQLSIKNALVMIVSDMDGKPGEDDTVFIHDAARPFLSEELVNSCYKALSGHDGVMPVLPVKDTVYLSSDGKRIDSLLDRSKVYSGQAPELFLLKKYHHANVSLPEEKILKINGSAECAVMDGMDVVMIPGDEKNFKVTTEEDMKKCRMIMEKGFA